MDDFARSGVHSFSSGGAPSGAHDALVAAVYEEIHLFNELMFRLGWLSGMEVINESGIEKTYPTRSIVV